MFGFCDKCRDMVKYSIETKEDICEVKGEQVGYIEKAALCNQCGRQIFVSEIVDENLQEIDRVYRENKGLISIEEIETILKKYDIGKKPLSSLLGWSEVTVSRYIDGQIPSKPYSDELLRILNDSTYMRHVLEANKGNISDLGYRKVDKKLVDMESIFLENLHGLPKIQVICKYIISLTGDITPLALQKLLYYVQGFYSAFVGDYVFEEDCEAWAHGPVYSQVYYSYSDYKYEPIDKYEENLHVFESVLSPDEIDIVNNVVRNFGRYSGKVLEKITHCERPWIHARGELEGSNRSNQIIEKDSIKSYFEDTIKSYGMIDSFQIEDYSRDIVEKISL